jgi:hypothetical protein
VRWTSTVRSRAGDCPTLVECGPGKVLTGLNKRIERSAICYALEDADSIISTKAATHVVESDLALVTGASRGIGHSIALGLGRAGATVVGTATTAEGAEKLSADFAAAGIKGSGHGLGRGSAAFHRSSDGRARRRSGCAQRAHQ